MIDKETLKLLEEQSYKNYFLFYLFDNFKKGNLKFFFLKIILAYILSIFFTFLNMFDGYSLGISYVIIEVVWFNYIDKKKYTP